MRLLILELTATLALWLCGCNMPSVTPQPVTPIQPANTTHTIKLEIGGDGKIQLVGGADIKMQNAASDQPRAEACDCGCGKSSCDCSARGNAGKRTSASTSATAGPQIVQTQKVYQCRNGVCGWYDVPVTQPKQTQRPAVIGSIKVYVQPNYLDSENASLAMRKAVGEAAGIEWVYGTPPAIDGQRHWPTAVRGDKLWSCPNGWTSESLKEFRDWLK